MIFKCDHFFSGQGHFVHIMVSSSVVDISLLVAKITFVVGEITFKVAMITSSVVKIICA